MNFRTPLRAATALVAALGALPVGAQTIVMKAADVHPAGYPNVVAIENMGKKMEAATRAASSSRCSRAACSAARRR